VIDPQFAALLESPCSLIVGTVDADGLPDACRGWGVEVLGPDRVRVLISANALLTRRNLEPGGAIALTATHFSLFDSVQVKGHAKLVEEATATDQIRFDRYCAGAARAIAESDGSPEELVLQFMADAVFACVMTVESMFDQTPGRSAGTQLAPEPT
jgi:predicted pyridoxine 5'-phosphate oxidase superfamily flavin-nucleotide-binding protein